MAIMMSDQIDHLDVAIPNYSELIYLYHRMRLWSFEESKSDNSNTPFSLVIVKCW